MKRLILLMITAIALGVGCADDDASPTAVATEPPASPATVPAVPEPPAPVHHTFASGQLIDVQDAGVFFIDIETGAAEAWVTPGSADNPFAFMTSSISDAGSRLIYSCLKSTASGLEPCQGAPGDRVVSYLFDTETGDRRALDEFGFDRQTLDTYGRQLLSLSPDGETILGIGDDGALVWASADDPDQIDTIPLTVMPGARPFAVAWAPDGDAAVVTIGQAGQDAFTSVLVRGDSATAISLGTGGAGGWSPEGALLALVDHDKTRVVDDQGRELWSRTDTPQAVANLRWSPDGSSLAIAFTSSSDSGIPERIEVVDGATGAAKYRVHAALACAGQIWNADGSLLLFGSYAYDGRLVAADPEVRTFSAPFDWYGLTPNPADPNLAILFEGESFVEVDLRTRERTRTIAETTVSPAWFFDHEPLFAGDRIVFTAPHLGHGGCGESGPAITTKPEPRFEFPPFDD